jgi:D-sedoheptulose 7-phosphate isomerase
MNDWLSSYIRKQKATLDSIPLDKVRLLIEVLKAAWKQDRQVFVFGNGGSAANSSHFATDLGRCGHPSSSAKVSGCFP